MGLPCLLFFKTATASYDYQMAGKTFAAVTIGMLVCIAGGYLVAVMVGIAEAAAALSVNAG